jgi:hypothetical protein
MASETVSGRKYSKDWGIIFFASSSKQQINGARGSKQSRERGPSQGLACSGIGGGSLARQMPERAPLLV